MPSTARGIGPRQTPTKTVRTESPSSNLRSMNHRSLTTVMYHYVRNFPVSRYPRLKGMILDDFSKQIHILKEQFEIASLESAMAFLRGTYQPSRPLCLLTFDDGLKEHYAEVTPLLSEQGVSGIFFVITGCQENAAVASVHMNHLLMATLDWATYQAEFLEALRPDPSHSERLKTIDPATVARTYPWDTAEVARFKYIFNFLLPAETKDRAVRQLFERHIGPEAAASRELYFDWEQAIQMQRAGMVIGGHTHRHQALATLAESDLRGDLEACRRLLDERLLPQPVWPFSYPYGKRDSYTTAAIGELKRLSFDCAFSTEPGGESPGADLFAIRRIDCKAAPPHNAERAA